MALSTEHLNAAMTNTSPMDFKEMLEIISTYRGICGNTAYCVDREAAAELYERVGVLFKRIGVFAP